MFDEICKIRQMMKKKEITRFSPSPLMIFLLLLLYADISYAGCALIAFIISEYDILTHLGSYEYSV